MTDLISVLIPSYNHARYIRESIQSVIDQSYANIELIIIDDGSSDTTLDILRELETICLQRFVRYLYIHQENKGTAATCRRLLSMVQGRYISILASDDCLKPEALRKLHASLKFDDAYVLAVGDNEMIDAYSHPVHWNAKQKSGHGIDFIYKTFGSFLQSSRPDVEFFSDLFGSYKTLIRGNYIPNGYLIRKDALDKTDAYNPSAPLEDWYMLLQLSKIGKMKYLDEVLFSYRWHDENSIKNKEKILNAFNNTMLFEAKNLFYDKKYEYLNLIEDQIDNNYKRNIIKIKNIIHLYYINFFPFKKIKFDFLGKSIFNIDFSKK